MSRVAAGVAVVALGAAAATAQPWEFEDQKLLAPDGEAGDAFGISVAIDGDTMVVGSERDDEIGPDSGAAHVFVLRDGAWLPQAKLVPDAGAASGWFGAAVSLERDLLLVGAPGEAEGRGAVYVFEREGQSWARRARLLASDGAAGDHFGMSVDLSVPDLGPVGVIVGAPDRGQYDSQIGAAYVFSGFGTIWLEQSVLTPLDPEEDGGWFGASVSISGRRLVVGAPLASEPQMAQGAAHFYRSVDQDRRWAHDGSLRGSREGSFFGWSAAIDGDQAVVGAVGDGAGETGAAYVLRRGDRAWGQEAALLPPDGVEVGQFGWAVAMSGDLAAVTAPGDSINGPGAGAVYVFERVDGAWSLLSMLAASDGDARDGLGFSTLGLRGETVVTGAWHDDDRGENAGAAYVFDEVRGLVCRVDLNGDGSVDTLDFLLFLNAWGAGDSDADWNGDGRIDALDMLAYLNDWVRGC